MPSRHPVNSRLRRPFTSVLLIAVLAVFAAPGATAFSGPSGPLVLEYDADASPFLLAVGGLRFEGTIGGDMIATKLDDVRLGPIPTLTFATRHSDGAYSNATHNGVALVIHSGSLVARSDEARLTLGLDAAYGIATALPAGDAADGRDSPAGVLVATTRLAGDLAWSREASTFLPINATVSLLDGNGRPLGGFDRATVNMGRTLGDVDEQEKGDFTIFETEGGFGGTWQSGAALLSTADSPDLRLRVRASPEDGFAQAAATFGDFGDAFDAEENPLEALAAFRIILNGAVLVANPGADAPRLSTLADGPIDTGRFLLVRGSDSDLAWTPAGLRLATQPPVALTSKGFLISAPPAIGYLPVAALILWLLAAGAIVASFVKRPPEGIADARLRWGGLAASILGILIAFVVYDRAFAAAFGTSALTLLMGGGLFGDSGVGIILALEFIPWSIAALLFALPARIGLGVALRYAGKGKSLKGFAAAGGWFIFAILAPMHALFFANAILVNVLEHMPLPW